MYVINNLLIEIDCEIAFIEIVIIKLLLVDIYHSPHGNIYHFFDIMEYSINQSNKQHIFGDFNMNFISNDKPALELVNLCNMYRLKMTVDMPTRGNNNFLDNVFTSLGNSYTITVVNERVSDHPSQVFTISIEEELKNCSREDFQVIHN